MPRLKEHKTFQNEVMNFKKIKMKKEGIPWLYPKSGNSYGITANIPTGDVSYIIVLFVFFYVCKFKYLQIYMYHRQQNKWYPKRFYLSISKLHSILPIANSLSHNNITLL